MSNSKSCSCGGNCCEEGPTFIFSCSGAADVGELSDKAAREMNKTALGSMYCLAGLGGNVSGIIKSSESAGKIFVIDGCPVCCAKKTLEEKGFNDFKHLMLKDLGFIKGQTEANKDNINKVLEKSKELLSN